MLIKQTKNFEKEKSRIIILSIISNSVLVLLKLVIGFSTGLVSIIAEAMHSGNDLVASLVAYVGVRRSLKPADKEHQYGHGKIEVITGWIENILILIIGAGIIYEGVHKLITKTQPQMIEIGIGLMIFSGVMNYVVSGYLIKKGRQLRSLGIEVDGEHLRADVVTSVGVAGALIILKLTGLWWIDPVSAILVGIWVLGIFFNLSKKLTQQIIDHGLEDDKVIEIEEILKSFPDVKGYHKIRTRQSGSTIFIDMHIQVQKNISIEKAHGMTIEIERLIKSMFIDVNVLIHVEPYHGS